MLNVDDPLMLERQNKPQPRQRSTVSGRTSIAAETSWGRASGPQVRYDHHPSRNDGGRQ